jgi:digeranylgeranylglycerophospholipid reductase
MKRCQSGDWNVAAKTDYDVVVVGAGPAGSTAAKWLMDKRPEARVLLVDKAPKIPRDKPCGGFVGPEVLDAFPYLQGQEKHFLESKSYAGILHSPDLRYQVGGRTQMLGILRSTFDGYLTKLAQKAGAQLKTRHRVTDVKIDSKAATVYFDTRRKVTTHAVIGADGVVSLVARRSGLHQGWHSNQVCKCVVKEFQVDPEFIEDHLAPDRAVHLYLGFNGTPGYAWFFPKTRHINAGLGCFANHPVKLMDYFQLFVKLLKDWTMLPSSARPEKVSAGLCPTVGPLDTTQRDRVLLIGDAAGFVSPATGAGILPGMISGRLAADTLIEALDHNRFDAEVLIRYQRRWEKHIGRFSSELMVQRIFLTPFCNLFIRIGQQDAAIRELVTGAQSHTAGGSYAQGVSIPRLLGRVAWDLLKGAFGQL